MDTKSPLDRITALEIRVSVLERVPQLEKDSKPGPIKRKHPRPFSKKAREVLLRAFDELLLLNNCRKITVAELGRHALSMENGDHIPANITAYGDSVRALIAERAGLNVHWSASAHEITSLQHTTASVAKNVHQDRKSTWQTMANKEPTE